MPFRASHRSFARSCVAEMWTVMLLRIDRRSQVGPPIEISKI